jgi:hypothetical protein
MIRAYGYIGEMTVTSPEDSLSVFLDARSNAAAIRSLAKAAERNLGGGVRAAPKSRLFAGSGLLGQGFLRRTRQDAS